MSDQRLKVVLGENPDSADGSVKRLLEERGAILFPCMDGFEVIRASFSKGPDVIILDTSLPRMNGYQCARVLKQDPLTRDIPILHLGTSPTPLERYWSKVCRADAYLTLPIQKDEWDTVIQWVWNRDLSRRRFLPRVSIVPTLEDRDILALATHLLEHDLLMSSVLNEINRVDTWTISSKDLVASLLAIIHSLFPFSFAAGLLIYENHSELYLRPWGDPASHEWEKRIQLLISDHLRDRHGYYIDPGDITTVWLDPGPQEGSGLHSQNVFLHTCPQAPVRSVLAFEDLNPEALPREELDVLHLALEMAHGVMEKRVVATTAQELSVIDETTGGYSMAFFMEVLDRELANARRHRYPVTLFTLHISNFEGLIAGMDVEDRAGLLKSIHGAILRTMRKTDIVARRTQGNFMFLLSHTSKENAAIAARRVKANILEDVTAARPGLGSIEVSMGGSEFDPSRHVTTEAFLKEAMRRRSPARYKEPPAKGRIAAGGAE